MEKNEVKATLILQAIGKPAEHLKKAVEEIVDKIKDEKGTEVESSVVKDPVEMEEQKGLFSTFAEINVKVEAPAYLMMLVFKYSPAHIEVTAPENLSFSNNDFGELLSELTRKIHQYDEVARTLQMQNQGLEIKLAELNKKK